MFKYIYNEIMKKETKKNLYYQDWIKCLEGKISAEELIRRTASNQMILNFKKENEK